MSVLSCFINAVERYELLSQIEALDRESLAKGAARRHRFKPLVEHGDWHAVKSEVLASVSPIFYILNETDIEEVRSCFNMLHNMGDGKYLAADQLMTNKINTSLIQEYIELNTQGHPIDGAVLDSLPVFGFRVATDDNSLYKTVSFALGANKWSWVYVSDGGNGWIYASRAFV